MSELEKKSNTIMQIHSPGDVMEFSKKLKQFIDNNKLSIQIQGKSYVMVDGWKFAGLNFGIVPMVKKPVNLSTEKEKKYECECELKKVGGEVIGFGYAICSNSESRKKNFDEYAVASMAQTRAISKAYRNLLGFIMNAAGFESTPAEEMEAKYTDIESEDLAIIEDNVRLLTTESEIINYYNSLPEYQKNGKFISLLQSQINTIKPVTELKKLRDCKNIGQLKDVYIGFSKFMQAHPEVIKAKNELKIKFK